MAVTKRASKSDISQSIWKETKQWSCAKYFVVVVVVVCLLRQIQVELGNGPDSSGLATIIHGYRLWLMNRNWQKRGWIPKLKLDGSIVAPKNLTVTDSDLPLYQI